MVDQFAQSIKIIHWPKRLFMASGLTLAAGLIAFLPWLPLVALLASSGLLLLLRWPWLCWVGLAASLPFTSSIKFGPLSMTEITLAATVALWLADGVRRRSLPLRGSKFLLSPLLYSVVLYLATFQAVDLGEAAAEVIKWLEFSAIILLVRSSIPPQQTHWLALALLLGAVGQALLGLYQFIFRIGPDWFIIMGRFMRASGSFQQPNPFAGYLGLTLPVALSLALWAWGGIGSVWFDRKRLRAGAAQNQGKDEVSPSLTIYAIWAVIYTTAAGVIGLGLLASWSRGAWIGAALATVVVMTVRSRRSALLGGVAGLILLVALLFGAFQPAMIPASVAQRVQDIPAYLGLTDVLNQPVTDENFAVIERLAHWVAAWRMWEGSPWLGVGPGNYALTYPDVRLPRWEEPLGHAHNIYLNVLAESGVLGMLAFLCFWGAMGWWVLRNLGRVPASESEWNRALAVGVLGVLVHLSIHNFFDNLFVQGIYIHLALWLALLDPTVAQAKPSIQTKSTAKL